MSEDIKQLQEKLKRLKLEKELKKLGGNIKHEKKETAKQEAKETYNEAKAREQIKHLQEQKAQYGGGIRNFLRKANINAQINQHANYLKEKQKIRGYAETTERLNQQAKMLEARNRVNELTKKNQVNFDTMLPFQSQNKQIKFEDIFR
jgi:hypothetical protein